jgi:hypothetical protein
MTWQKAVIIILGYSFATWLVLRTVQDLVWWHHYKKWLDKEGKP